MAENKGINIPICLFIFKRLDTTKKVLDRVREVKPPRMFIVGEGPRPQVPGEAELVQQVRNMVEQEIDWPCQVFKNYVQEDIGVGKRMSTGIDWVFEHEEKAIFLEDDILADQSFFFFAEEMLEKYENDYRVMMVSGYKHAPEFIVQDSYLFTVFGSIWGWASWRRAWKYNDFTIRNWPQVKNQGIIRHLFNTDYSYCMFSAFLDNIINGFDTWDYQWDFARMVNSGLTIVPKENLVMNIGFRNDAAHTVNSNNGKETFGDIKRLEFPLIHPQYVITNHLYDETHLNLNFFRLPFRKRALRKIKRILSKD